MNPQNSAINNEYPTLDNSNISIQEQSTSSRINNSSTNNFNKVQEDAYRKVKIGEEGKEAVEQLRTKWSTVGEKDERLEVHCVEREGGSAASLQRRTERRNRRVLAAANREDAAFWQWRTERMNCRVIAAANGEDELPRSRYQKGGATVMSLSYSGGSVGTDRG
ncbi:unnamed protein product [Vicia faba]|uniref:Uncharacterized protein n=1 Tax=Vicia faba TaxID=3906 RepID=A0AAV0YKN5_VICFA|nr:unnamed protein product [Vicia faba]